jgi:iron complex transport system substrate-binding protein
MMKFTLVPLLFLAVLGCREKVSQTPGPREDSVSSAVRYAVGFAVSTVGRSKLVEVTYPFQGATSGYKYLLVNRNDSVPQHDPDTRVIRVPIRNIVCTSTTHIPLLDYLGETNSLSGFPTLDYISSEKMRKRIDAGQVTELGVDKGIDLERIAILQPDLVMGYTMTSDYGQFKKIEDLRIPVVLNGDYLEKHPLGRAEWMKFMALFFEKEKLADSLFNQIEKNYLETRSLTSRSASRPTVMSGIVYGDAWFLPGGKNYAATLLQDAGCRYLWEDDPSHGYLQLSFEKVYEKAHDADLWIGTGNFADLSSLRSADQRYAQFKPFKTRNVYTNDARHGAKGGSEFLELGYVRPDLILKDLVKIAHPELLPDYQLYFHKKLE